MCCTVYTVQPVTNVRPQSFLGTSYEFKCNISTYIYKNRTCYELVLSVNTTSSTSTISIGRHYVFWNETRHVRRVFLFSFWVRSCVLKCMEFLNRTKCSVLNEGDHHPKLNLRGTRAKFCEIGKNRESGEIQSHDYEEIIAVNKYVKFVQKLWVLISPSYSFSSAIFPSPCPMSLTIVTPLTEYVTSFSATTC